MKYVANLTDGWMIDVIAESLPEAMKILNQDFIEYRRGIISWTGPTGIIFQMHDPNMGV